jgi:hypothetical protein
MNPRLMMLLSALRARRELTSPRDERDAQLAAAVTSMRRGRHISHVASDDQRQRGCPHGK